MCEEINDHTVRCCVECAERNGRNESGEFDSFPEISGDTVSEHFALSLTGGGGEVLLRGALVRKFRDLITRGSHGVLLVRTHPDCRYTQTLLTPVGSICESVGDEYLARSGDHLSEFEVLALQVHGWHPPLGPAELEAFDPGDQPSKNWRTQLHGEHFVEQTVDLLVSTIINVHGLQPGEDLSITIFPADYQYWEWISDPDDPDGGHLEGDD